MSEETRVINESNGSEAVNMPRSYKGLIMRVALIAVLIALVAGLFGAYNAGRENAAEQAARVQGNVKMTEIDLNSMLDGYIDEVCVAEGDQVTAGEVLIRIEPDIVEAKVGEAQAGLAQAQAAYAAAQAVLTKAENGARSEDIAQAKAAYDYAAKSYERLKNLYAEGAVSANAFDEVEAKYLAAKAVYEQAETGARSEDIAAARAQVAQAQAAVSQYESVLREAQSYLEHAVIVAPADGVVTAVNVEKGELISTGMALASLRSAEDAWVEVNVPETMLGQIKEGQQVGLEFPAYPEQSFIGTVSRVSQNPDFATKKATNENGSFDVLSYCVKIRLDNMGETLYAGMTVLVDFEAGRGADKGDDLA